MKEQVKNGIVITLSVLLVIVLVYLATAFFLTKEIGPNKKKTTTTTNEGSVTELYSDMILASQTFAKAQSEYMVIFFSNKEMSESIKTGISYYKKDTKLYKVNLDEAINKFVVSKEENAVATNASELKINKTTLVIIKNGKIDSYITNEDDILSKLK